MAYEGELVTCVDNAVMCEAPGKAPVPGGFWEHGMVGIVLEEEETLFASKFYRLLTSAGVVGWVLGLRFKVER